MQSKNPYNNQLISDYQEFSAEQVNCVLRLNHEAWKEWKITSFDQRAERMFRAAAVLRERKKELAELITLEMGKRIAESLAEIDKCAWVCEYYAENAAKMLTDEPIETDGQRSMAIFQAIGSVLAVMPWNYPFWQVFRFAAPTLMAGNAGLLKHASNVQGCALAIEKVFMDAGFPENIFRTLVIGSSKVEAVIADPRVKAVTLTGSERAGAQVAASAAKHLKKAVLELGGSDPCIVLADADLDEAASVGVQSRMLTSGQTCIAAKRFIVQRTVAAEFKKKMMVELEKYQPGDPMDEETMLAPLASRKFAEEIHKQVEDSVNRGAKLEMGGMLVDEGCFYPVTLLSDVTPEMPVFREETFGPVAAFVIVDSEEEAIVMANNSLFGLGAAIWTKDVEKGEKLARQIEAGAVFVNGLVKSDPRLPFGGIKNSGFGRELSHYGIKEFCNIKSVWVK